MLKKLAVLALRVIYAPIKLLPRKNKIAIFSRQSDVLTEDIALLSEHIEAFYPDIICVVKMKMLKSPMYAFHMLSQMYHIATAKLVLLDTYCITASVLRHKKGTKVIQMWHSSAAIKKFGYQTLDMPGGSSSETARAMHMHENYDWVLCPSEATGKLFCQGFNVGSEKLRYYALPRFDRILKDDGKWREAAKKEFGLDDGRETVLYVPTFRKGSRIPLEPLAEAIDSEKFRLVVKLHPLDIIGYFDSERCAGVDQNAANGSGEESIGTGNLVCEAAGGQCAQDKSLKRRDVADALEDAMKLGDLCDSTTWLRLCDRIITDYSAIGIEATVLDKPLYFYVYDIAEYAEDVGLNIDPLQEMPGCSAKDAAELASMIESGYDFQSLHAFRDKYIEAPVDNATGRLAEFLTEMVK